MIGYYAHSHGSGHCNYANIFAGIFGSSLTVLTDRGHAFDQGTKVVMLENEDPDGSEFERDGFPEPRALHYAPVNMSKITERNRLLLDTIIGRGIRLLIIDVSVEMAMLARVSSVPYAYVRLQGDRNDLPHLNAYEGASLLLAYYPEEMESRDTPPWVRKKTIYLGFLSRFSLGTGRNRPSERPKEYARVQKPVLLYITGFGGSRPLDFGTLSRSYDIFSIGPVNIGRERSDIVHIGVVKCIRAFIEHANIVVAACGSNTTAEILSLGKGFVAVPETRHYHEQQHLARNLDRLGWGVDLSKYQTLKDAVARLEKLGDKKSAAVSSDGLGTFKENRPEISLDGLRAFRKKLVSCNFRADRFMEDYRKERAEPIIHIRPEHLERSKN